MASKQDEMVGPLGIPGGVEGNGADGTSGSSVGWRMIVKNLRISTELDFHGVVVGARVAGDNCSGAECL